MTNLLWLYVDKYGCGTYRVYLPAYSLEQLEEYSSSFLWQEDILEPKAYIGDLVDADIVIFQRCGREIFLKMIDECKQRGIRTVYELDDNLFDVPRHNPAAWIWRRKPLQTILRQMLGKVDLVTVSTEPLRDIVNQQMGWEPGKVVVCHNHLHEVAWGPEVIGPVVPHNNKGKTVIGWQGSTTHDIDFKEAIPALARILEKYPDVVLRLFGDVPRSLKGVIPENRFEWTGGVLYEDYPSKLRYCNFDIGIAPVQPSAFNNCKSNIKWLEYSAIKVPTVASRVYAYEKSITSSINGLLASNEEEWFSHLSTLIENPDLRKSMGEAAFAQVWAQWSSIQFSPAWDRAFHDLVAEKIGG